MIAPAINLIDNAVAIAPASVSVGVFLSNTNPGLSFTSTAAVGPGEIAQLLLGYKISGASFTGDSLSLSSETRTGGAQITAIQNSCLGAAFVPQPPNFPGTCPGEEGLPLVVANSGTDSMTFDAVTTIGILHDLTLDAGPSNNGRASGATVTDRFVATALPVPPSEVPEPSSSLLLTSGLAVAGIARHLKMKGII